MCGYNQSGEGEILKIFKNFLQNQVSLVQLAVVE
jgi:hypothetical protein